MEFRSIFLAVLFLVAFMDSTAKADSLDTFIVRHYTNATLSDGFDTNIILKGSLLHVVTFKSPITFQEPCS